MSPLDKRFGIQSETIAAKNKLSYISGTEKSVEYNGQDLKLERGNYSQLFELLHGYLTGNQATNPVEGRKVADVMKVFIFSQSSSD